MFYITDKCASETVFYTSRGTWVFPIRFDTALKFETFEEASQMTEALRKRRALQQKDFSTIEVIEVS